MINIPLIKVLLPKQSFYPSSYIRQAKFVCVPWIAKAISHYRTLIGGIEYEGTLIPKSLITGENSQFKKIKVNGLRAAVTCWEIADLNSNLLKSIDKLTHKLREFKSNNESISDLVTYVEKASKDQTR